MTKFFLLALLVCCFIAISQSNPTGRVVGGVDATESEFPFQISLRRSGSHTCGGSIITRNYVLTAAHCVTYEDENGKYIAYSPSLYDIRAGSNDRLNGGVVLKVTEITFNQNYGDFLNDVALLLLEKPLTFSQNIQPIHLATREVPSGSPVIISGWGRLKTGGDIPIKLQWNTLEAISKTQCYDRINRYSDTLLCLAHMANNGACNGDSGGPATYNNELVGVAGFVVGGCGSNYPDGYAKVFYHVDWIKANSDL